MSEKYFSKVYDGPYKDTGKWCMWYTTCPKCVKKYGKNYVVIIGKTN